MAVRTLPGGNRVRAGEREPGFSVIELGWLPGIRRVAHLASLSEALLLVIRIIGVVVIRQMARDAGRLRQVVIAIDVAVGAGPRRNRVLPGKHPPSLGMIELAIRPLHGVVTGRTGGREFRTDVIDGRLGVVVVVLVARDTGSIGDVVVVVYVAVRALPWGDQVRSGQRESGLRVIELRRLPRSRRVTGLALLRKALLRVIRVSSVLEIFQVATDACRLRQVVVVVDVTIRALAWRDRMCPI